MAKSGRKTAAKGAGRSGQPGQDDTGSLPLRPKAQYKPRGQSLGDLPNTDLMPGPEQSRQTIKPRQVGQDVAPTADRSAGMPKAAMFAALGAVVIAVGAFLAFSGDGPADVATTVEPAAIPATAVSDPANTATEAQTTADTATVTPAPAAEEPAPFFIAQAPVIDTRQASAPDELTATTIAPIAPANPINDTTPELLVSTPAAQVFSCANCTPYIPGLETVTVVYQLPATVNGAEVGTTLRALGAKEIAEKKAPLATSTNQVRFYNADDQPAVTALATQYGATLVDLTWYAPAPDVPTLELWLNE